MLGPEQPILLDPKYRRPNGMWSLDIDQFQIPAGFNVIERRVIYLPPGAIGGNHKHPRQELFIGVGDLELIWLEDGKMRKRSMFANGEPSATLIPSMVPHAIINRSETCWGLIVEFADRSQHDVERIQVVSSIQHHESGCEQPGFSHQRLLEPIAK